MPQIDSYAVDTFGGFMPRAARATDRLTNFPNVDGCAVVVGAWAVDPIQMPTSSIVDSLDAADDLIDNFRSLQSDPPTPITVVDQFGWSYPGTIVLDVRIGSVNVLADGTVRVDMLWTFQVATDEP